MGGLGAIHYNTVVLLSIKRSIRARITRLYILHASEHVYHMLHHSSIIPHVDKGENRNNQPAIMVIICRNSPENERPDDPLKAADTSSPSPSRGKSHKLHHVGRSSSTHQTRTSFFLSPTRL